LPGHFRGEDEFLAKKVQEKKNWRNYLSKKKTGYVKMGKNALNTRREPYFHGEQKIEIGRGGKGA